MDHAGLGARRRYTGGNRIRPAESVDQLLLGRRIYGSGGMSGVRSASAAARHGPYARRGAAGRGTRTAPAQPAVRIDISGAELLLFVSGPGGARIVQAGCWSCRAASVCPRCIVLVQNKQVTGSWTTLPYALSQYQYGVPASSLFSRIRCRTIELTREQELDYRMQRAFRGAENETLWSTYLQRLVYRVRYYRFFLPTRRSTSRWLSFWSRMREYRFVWVALTALIFALGTNFFPPVPAALHRGGDVSVCTDERGRTANAQSVAGGCGGCAGAGLPLRRPIRPFWYTLLGPDRIEFPIRCGFYQLSYPGPSEESPSTGNSPRRRANCWCLSAIGRSIFFRRSGFITRPILTEPASYGRAIWATPRMRSCGVIIPIGRYYCLSRTGDR